MTNDTIFTHVPMCLHCDEKEIVGNFTYENGDGFCSAECSNTAHEEMFAAHSISVEEYYQPALCTQCKQREAVEDGFCSFECENTTFAELHRGAVEWVDSEVRELDNSALYDDFLSQYDDDPSPYGGTYSEE